MICEKKEISRDEIIELCNRFGCSALTASILVRRGITNGESIQYYLENDLRYLHSPFLLSTMEDAVDRILDAKEEGEKVLVFGDRDVDGITSTTILYQCLVELGIDVKWRIPTGEDAYGLSINAVEEFAAEYGTLIITVDCGISNNQEIERANQLGIDVIVTDHHNPPEELPDAAVIVNPKMPNSGYPFPDISGCTVAYKLACALRFAKTELYKQEICLLNVRPVNEAYIIECAKIVNMTERGRLSETIVPGMVRIENTRLIPFLRGQQILVWDAPLQKKQLQKIFGNGVEFNMMDIREQVASVIPAVKNASLLRVKEMSKILHYKDGVSSELDGFCNIFITYINKKTSNPQQNKSQDLQLVALAALADIMPLQNENRILVRQGIMAINKGNIPQGILELMARLNMTGKRCSSTDLSWNLVPVLNAAGRLGQAELAVQLFLEEDKLKRDKLAEKIIELNKERRQLGNDAWTFVEKQAYESFESHKQKLVVVKDSRIHRGVCGILASNLVKVFNVPAIAITIMDGGTAVGSIRSTRGFDVTGLLAYCSELFINHGGHNFAAGFSLQEENLPELLDRLLQFAPEIELEKEKVQLPFVDAEIPHEWLNPELLNVIDSFEPYGESNPPLLFLSRNLKIIAADTMGKGERRHLKLTLDAGKNKWPGIIWGAAEKLGQEFNVGDYVNVLYQIERNLFNGTESAQMIISAIEKNR
ncbi:MAG: single-stranded-DNA-specific exonuclease RecJ [Spirochaetaceae bacterium]|nr:single-stranded-DNA-specific exonuclease RecJ [Spirochaetaceae bacterium]